MKWRFEDIRVYMNQNGQSFDYIFEQIKDNVAKTLIATCDKVARPINRLSEHRGNVFELFGFDFLVDGKQKVWLLETNVGPSVNQDSKLDKIVKLPMLVDLFNILGMRPFKRKKKNQKKKKAFKGDNFGHRKRNFTSCADLKKMDKNNFKEILSPDDYSVLFESDEEFERRGNFVRVFPTLERVEKYGHMIDVEKSNNILLWKHMFMKQKGFNLLHKVTQ